MLWSTQIVDDIDGVKKGVAMPEETGDKRVEMMGHTYRTFLGKLNARIRFLVGEWMARGLRLAVDMPSRL